MIIITSKFTNITLGVTSIVYVPNCPLNMLSLYMTILCKLGSFSIEICRPLLTDWIAQLSESPVYMTIDGVGSSVLGFQMPSHFRLKGSPV